MNTSKRIDDLRISTTRPLVPPSILIEEVAQSEETETFIDSARETITDIVLGKSDRLLVVVGPCSIHSIDSARAYADWLKETADRYADRLVIVMRAYFEKPRTTVGWKGFINDPELNGSHRINKGLREARQFLLDLAAMALPCGTEFLDMTVPQYIADLVSWGAIGARTSESQPHRELASGLSMPVGFKNGTDGRVQSAVEAVLAAREPHWFASSTKDGVAAHFRSTGNETCHIILRGGSKTGPNYYEPSVQDACRRLEKAGLLPRVMIDCSHGNSQKDPNQQKSVAVEVARQISQNPGTILGVMIESNLVAGRQDVEIDKDLTFGQSITDACIGLDQTEELLSILAGCSH